MRFSNTINAEINLQKSVDTGQC